MPLDIAKMALNYTTTPGPIETRTLEGNGRSLFVPAVISLSFGIVLFLKYCKSTSQSSLPTTSQGKEPPSLTSSIPFVGHLIGMLRYQVGYMQMLR